MTDLNAVQVILVLIVAFFAGMEGILDQFHFHQPVIACTLIGLATGHLIPCVMLGGSLQMIALGWANVGAAVAPDAALASVASAIILVLGGRFDNIGIKTAIAIAVPLAVAGLLLTVLVRTLTTGVVHAMDKAAEKGSFAQIDMWQYIAIAMQGLRIAIPAGLIMAVGSHTVSAWLKLIPKTFSEGLVIGGGMVVAVGYAMVINMMASREVWPFFAIGFVLAIIPGLKDSLIGLGAIGLSLALIYLALSKQGSGSNNDGGNAQTGDSVGDIIDNY